MWESFLESVLVSVVAIAVTFALMSLLIGFIALFKYVFNYIAEKDRPKQAVPQPQAAVQTPQVPLRFEAEGIDEETVAVISAAVAACLEREAQAMGVPSSGFVVRSIRRRV